MKSPKRYQMNFPAYIPLAVKKQVIWYLEGDKTLGWEGWNACLKKGTEADSIKRDVDCIERLVLDSSMRFVYESLNQFNDSQWDLFFKAAWVANADYLKVRQAKTIAHKKIKEIRKKALELSQLLEKIQSSNGDFPGELFNTFALLEASVDRFHWMGNIVLGGNDATPEDQRNILHYVWSKAPPPSDLLKIMAASTLNYVSVDQSYIGKAIDSRKQNRKAEYLRAFKALLNEYGIDLTPDVKNAIVHASQVVLNDPDIDVSYDDVRHR